MYIAKKYAVGVFLGNEFTAESNHGWANMWGHAKMLTLGLKKQDPFLEATLGLGLHQAKLLLVANK